MHTPTDTRVVDRPDYWLTTDVRPVAVLVLCPHCGRRHTLPWQPLRTRVSTPCGRGRVRVVAEIPDDAAGLLETP